MSADDRPTITPKPDGPYVVKNLSRVSNRKGAIAVGGAAAFCRCGGSGNKPFCDGTHAKIGFSSVNAPRQVENRRVDYVGSRITVHDNRGICAHAGHCTDRLPGVFRMRQEPWIDPDGASPEQIVEAVRRCPSGALSYTVDGVEQRDREGPPAIFVSENGPYEVTGRPDLVDAAWGEGASKEHFTLCRCGGSKNKPFCDGTHWHIGFKDEKN
jgi:CDGSH-type Zn-finger protein/ferredoxin